MALQRAVYEGNDHGNGSICKILEEIRKIARIEPLEKEKTLVTTRAELQQAKARVAELQTRVADFGEALCDVLELHEDDDKKRPAIAYAEEVLRRHASRATKPEPAQPDRYNKGIEQVNALPVAPFIIENDSNAIVTVKPLTGEERKLFRIYMVEFANAVGKL